MELQTKLLFITTFVNSVLSLFVLFGKRDRTNIVYSLFVLFASMWSVGLALFIGEVNLNVSLVLANFYYFAAAGIPAFFLYFTLIFPNENRVVKKSVLYIFLPLITFGILVILNKKFLINEVYKTNWGKDVIFNFNIYFIYTVYFVVYVLASYYNLFRSYQLAKNKDEINQIRLLVAGTLIGFVFGMLFNLVLPILGNYRLIWLGPVFSFSMVVSIAYSINKYHLFNIKVVATQLLVFMLWLFILIRTLISTTLIDQVTNGSLLLVTVIVGIFLVRSVIKEVRLREELNESNQKLKEANEGQVSLMHFMNHQVKGRFGNAKNIFAELLTNDYGEMPKDAKPLLEKGLDEVNMGIDYVQNVLRGASAENGKIPYDMKPIDFKPILETSFAKEKERAEAKGLRISLEIKDGEYLMQGDARQLGEAVRNLIDNSINYTQNGCIDVSMSGDKYAIKLLVKDTGVGIIESDKPDLFKSGIRGTDSLKINVNSTGYGLAFVKGVVDAHKGRVWAESEGKGKGSTFFVELPKG